MSPSVVSRTSSRLVKLISISICPADGDWETWSKVVLTNKSETNGATVVKEILSLDPYWVYEVVEDDWGWAYTLTGSVEGSMTTSTVELNPFKFTNKEKTDVVKHAEAVTINHFATSSTAGDAKEEHYKSSKVQAGSF